MLQTTKLAVLVCLALALLGAKPKADKGAEEDTGKLKQEAAVQRSIFLAVSEMQRMYEAMRLTASLDNRHVIAERMRDVLDERILPLVSAVEENWGEKPVSCDPSDSVEKIGCVRRDVALALIYRGLARALEGFHLDATRYLACAEKYYPDVQSVAVFLRKPPEFDADDNSALLNVPDEKAVIRELMEPLVRIAEERTSVADAMKRRERAKWPMETEALPFRALPEVDKLPREAKRFTGPQVSLENVSFEPIQVASESIDYYTKVAKEDLERLFERLYIIQGKEGAVCPDPRVLYLPRGKYRLYSSKFRDFPQTFIVKSDGQRYVLEYFFAASRDEEPPTVRLAFYPEPGLCDGRPCEEEKEAEGEEEDSTQEKEE